MITGLPSMQADHIRSKRSIIIRGMVICSVYSGASATNPAGGAGSSMCVSDNPSPRAVFR